jgi:hypothetical protein
MDKRGLIYLFCLVWAALVLPACGGQEAAVEPTATSTLDLVATEVAVQKAALATLTAAAPTPETQPTATATLSPTPTPAAGSASLPTPTPPLPTPTTVAQPTPASCTTAVNVNLRQGPGTAYEPPIGAIPAGTTLTPLAFSPTGVPDGQWLQVQSGGQIGWISAGPQFVSCTIELATLPAVVVPPPPPTPTAVPPTQPPPPPLAEVVPVDGNDGNQELRGFEPLNDSRYVVLPGYTRGSVQESPPVFRDKLVFRVEVFDPAVDFRDGAGINEVQFTIINRDRDDETVYEHTEANPGYCAFGGGEPTCTVWVFAGHDYRWPDNGPPIENANYRAVIEIRPDHGEDATWNWDFVIEGAPDQSPPSGEIEAEIVQIGPGSLDTTVAGALVFQVEAFHTGYGHDDGDGIDRVEMFIIDDNGEVVHQRTEGNARYCAFGGGEPDCNVLSLDQIAPGFYTLRAVVYAEAGPPETVEINIEIQ